MKHFLVFVIAFVSLAGTINAQQVDSLQNQVMKLLKYYESYDNGSPESLKKAKYNDAVDEISAGTATEKDKTDAYKIIDAYIKGDKALEQKTAPKDENKESFDEMIQNTDEVQQTIKLMEQQQSKFMNMSYSEFEKTMLNVNPVAGKKEMKQAYNQLHKNDGKQVAISEKDNEMTETQKQVWAFDVLNNPKNYEEFRKACKILNPDFPEDEIKKGWNKRDK